MREDSPAEVTPILSFAEVTTESDGAYDGPLWGVDFALCPGELLLVRLERGHFRMPLADVALGLVTAIRGVVKFYGEDWFAANAESRPYTPALS